MPHHLLVILQRLGGGRQPFFDDELDLAQCGGGLERCDARTPTICIGMPWPGLLVPNPESNE